METAQLNKASASLAALNVFDTPAFQPLWQAIPKLAAAVGDLRLKTARLLEDAGLQGTPITGIAGGKNRARVAMCESVLPLAGILHAQAIEAKNDEAAARTLVTATDLDDLQDAEVAPACQRLLDAARAALPALTDEGVDGADLDAAQTSIDVYRPLVSAARAGIAKRKGITGEIVGLLAETDAIQEKRIDPRMRQFEAKQPAFFAAYVAARKILNLGLRHEVPAAAGGAAAGSVGA